MYETLLVPLDGSTFSEHALPAAADVAERTGAGIRLALVHTPLLIPDDSLAPPTFGQWEAEYRDREETYLEREAERLRERGLRTETELRDGDVGRELTELADRADLVVMATHGRGGLERAWLGSVADSVIRHADAPVLLIRPEEGDDEEEPGTSPPFTAPGHVLAATDGSPAAMAAVDEAVTLARLFDARLTLLRVTTFPGGLASPYIPHTAEMDRAVVEEADEAARRWLADVAADVEGLAVETMVAQAFQPARGILRAAADSGADLLALGTHRRTRLGRVVLGSTADKVIRASRMPVLVAHAPE